MTCGVIFTTLNILKFAAKLIKKWFETSLYSKTQKLFPSKLGVTVVTPILMKLGNKNE